MTHPAIVASPTTNRAMPTSAGGRYQEDSVVKSALDGERNEEQAETDDRAVPEDNG